MRLHIIIFIYCIISMPVKCKKIILNAFTFPHFFFIFHLIYCLLVFCESSQNWTKNQTELLKLLALPIKRQQRWNKHSHWAQRIERSTKVCFFKIFFWFKQPCFSMHFYQYVGFQKNSNTSKWSFTNKSKTEEKNRQRYKPDLSRE